MGNTTTMTSTTTTLAQKLENAKLTKRLHLANEKEFTSKRVKWADFKDAKLVDLSGVNLDLVPPEFAEFVALETLKLDRNPKMVALQPEVIGRLKSLRVLTCNDNPGLSVCAVLPASLKTLELARCGLAGVIESPQLGLCFCPQLVSLNLAGNRITHLGAAFGFEILALLEELDLSGNPLEVVPDAIGTLPRLKTLRLEKTLVATLPYSLLAESSVAFLELARTRITKETFLKMRGVDAFLARRQVALSKGLAGGVAIDSSLCGLD